jgi:hypothetical protein
MHVNTGYDLVHQGRFPVEVVLIGKRYFCRANELDLLIYGPNGKRPKSVEDDGRVSCPVCGRRFKQLPQHTRAMHPEP